MLGITKEKIKLPSDICAWFNFRSSYARLGLMSHITAPFIYLGVKICHIIFQEIKEKVKYKGKCKNQKL